MILDDIQEVIDNAVCPESFPEDMRIGECYFQDNSHKLLEHFPENSCDAFIHIKTYKDNAALQIHTHGISINIGDTKVNIHNSQIIIFDYWHLDDKIEYNRSDTRASRVGFGLLLAGPIGAAAGLATSFGKGKKHLKRDNLVIAYWDNNTKTQQIINLRERSDSEKGSIKAMIDFWKEQKTINETTGRQPVGEYKAGVGEGGCLGGIVLFLIPFLALLIGFINFLL